MKRLQILLLLLATTVSTMLAGDTNYYNIGRNAKFNAYRFEGNNYIIMSFIDDNENRLSNFPIVKIKLGNEQILRLQGFDNSKQIASNAINLGFGLIAGGTVQQHFVIFQITDEQIEQLQYGIAKLTINTIPEIYTRTVKNDKVGNQLFLDFKRIMKQPEY